MALLVMDMQTAMLSRLPDAETLISNVARAISNARDRKIPVIYVTIGFRPGAPELNINGKGEAAKAGRERWTAGFTEEFMKIHPGVAPRAEDILVIKRRVSAFSGSDLEVVLRAQDIQHLVLTGYATSGVVLSTVREAADKDYFMTVLSDCCANNDDEVHRVLITRVFPRQADVLTVEEWSGPLNPSKPG